MKNSDKIIVSLCGGSGAWEKDYKENGYTVFNITFPKYDVTDFSIYDCYDEKDRYLEFLNQEFCNTKLQISIKDIYGILAAPPCTQFSFARTNAKVPRNLEAGMDIVVACLSIIWQCQYRTKKEHQRKPSLKFWCLENPNAALKWFLGRPIYKFHPYEFGDKYTKSTCLWGYFNIPTKQTYMNMGYKSIHKKCWTVKNRQEIRGITPAGFARSFYEANK